MKIKIALVAIFLLAAGISVTSIIQNKSREREGAAVATALNSTTTPPTRTTAEQFCVPNGTYKFSATDLLTLTTNKKRYESGETVIATLTLKNNKATGGQSSYAFSCTAEVQLYADQLYDTRGMVVTRNVHSIKLARGASKTYTFRFPANKSGAFTLTANVQGYDKFATTNIGIGADPTPPGVPGYIIDVVPAGTNNGTFATSVTPILRPPTTPIVGPILPPGGLPPATTTPTSTPPGVVVPITGDKTMLPGKSRESYVAISNTLAELAKNPASDADKSHMLAISNAMKTIIAETSISDWDNPDKNPNLVVINIGKNSQSLATVPKKSFLASVYQSIKSLFGFGSGTEVAGVQNLGGWKIDNVTVANNTCIRYTTINTEIPYDFANEVVLEETSWKLALESENKNYHNSIYAFKFGMCSPLSVYESLKTFDVAAARDENEFDSRHGTSPSGNQMYYDKGGAAGSPQSPERINWRTLDIMTERAAFEVKRDDFGFARPISPNAADRMNMHTAFNSFGPADFTCSAYILNSTSSAEFLKSSADNCRSGNMISYGMVGDYGGHGEHIKKVEYSTSSKVLTITTNDGFNQNGSNGIGGGALDFKKATARRETNIYAFKFNKDGEVPKLQSITLPLGFDLATRNYMFGPPSNLKPLLGVGIISCTDKSDVIRTKVSEDEFEARYNHEREYWLYMKDRSSEFWKAAQDRNPNAIIRQPDFSSCNIPDDLAAAKTLFKDQTKAWQKKWNKAAYENRGYVHPDKKYELIKEKAKIDDDVEKLLPQIPCIVQQYRDIDRNEEDTRRYKWYTGVEWTQAIPKATCEDFTGGSATPPPKPPVPPTTGRIDQ